MFRCKGLKLQDEMNFGSCLKSTVNLVNKDSKAFIFDVRVCHPKIFTMAMKHPQTLRKGNGFSLSLEANS